jgi:hypothetical protein
VDSLAKAASAPCPPGVVEGRRRRVVGVRGYADLFLLAARWPGHRFKRGVCTLPRRIEVAAIKRDQRARGFQDRVGLIRQGLTADVRKSWCQPTNRFELTDQYGGRRR